MSGTGKAMGTVAMGGARRRQRQELPEGVDDKVNPKTPIDQIKTPIVETRDVIKEVRGII